MPFFCPLNIVPAPRALGPLLLDRDTPRVSLVPCLDQPSCSRSILFDGPYLSVCEPAYDIPTEILLRHFRFHGVPSSCQTPAVMFSGGFILSYVS